MAESWTLHCDGEGHERGKRGDGKARPDRVAEQRTGLPWKRKRGGMEGEEDRMEKAEDSAEERPDRRLGDRKGNCERSFGPHRLAKEGQKMTLEADPVQIWAGEPASPCPQGLP